MIPSLYLKLEQHYSMDNKNYLWIGIGVIAVVIALLLVMKSTDKSDWQATPGVVETETGSLINDNTVNEVVNETVETPVVEMPLATETVISANGQTFSPKSLRFKTGEKVFITLSAKDDANHKFQFIDADLSFITMDFGKDKGDQSITFPAPAPGTYSFFIDDEDNTGQLIIE